MAVYTQVSEQELREFLSAYDLGQLIGLEGIAAGTENTNYRLETEQERCILTIYEKRVSAADLPFFLLLMEHCADAGVPCPKPVRSRDRKTWRMLANKPAALVSYLYGKSVVRPEASHAEAVGAGLADLHNATAGYGEQRENSMRLSAWCDLIKKCGQRGDELRPGLTAELEAELAFLEGAWPESLPKGIIHADLFPDNVLFAGGKLSGLIDFYFACTDLYAYDLAICFNSWCFEDDVTFNITKARAFLRGYQSKRPLQDAEIEALPVLCRGAAMRFLSTRLYDWFHAPQGGAKRDPLSQYKRLTFHQQVKNAGEYGL